MGGGWINLQLRQFLSYQDIADISTAVLDQLKGFTRNIEMRGGGGELTSNFVNLLQ